MKRCLICTLKDTMPAPTGLRYDATLVAALVAGITIGDAAQDMCPLHKAIFDSCHTAVTSDDVPVRHDA